MVSAPFDNEQYRNQEGKATEKRNRYQKVIICLRQFPPLIFVYGDAIFALPGDVLLWLQRCDFRTVKKSFHCLQRRKICTFPPKIVAIGNHFFEWLKTAISSNACGMSTLKSPLSRGSDAPHVHQRLRKHLARCTLDCGFKTPESPALRGFVGGPRALATAALYLAFFFVLEKGSKSAGNAVIPTFPAHCPHGLQHLRHKRPTFAFTSESGHTLGSRRKIAHNGSHGETRGVSDGGGITTLGAFRTFTNIPGPGIRTANFAAFGVWSGVLPKNAESLRDSDALMRVAVPRRRGPAGLRDLFATW